ncbi:hypothetical protein KFK09_012386 [Dendrobium nobile]|uniref:Uncharacterized protein n=1 Tax=Dendrobium nobile TaxID=94219 RepID=A0A8T3BH91_DENNO|nr:hypothetical protein KFK09_012386 [Dendrobium nobile]
MAAACDQGRPEKEGVRSPWVLRTAWTERGGASGFMRERGFGHRFRLFLFEPASAFSKASPAVCSC